MGPEPRARMPALPPSSLPDDEGVGDHITEALILARSQHADEGHEVEEPIYEAQNRPLGSGLYAGRPAGLLPPEFLESSC